MTGISITQYDTRMVRAGILFLVLQMGDALSTLALFAHNGYEANPLMAHAIGEFGAIPAIVGAKIVTVALFAFLAGLRPSVVRKANVAYAAIIVWNLFLISIGILSGH
jgi:hypothetical protein